DEEASPTSVAGVVGHWEAKALLKTRGRDEAIQQGSVDLGMTRTTIFVMEDGVGLCRTGDAPELLVRWTELEDIVQKAKKGQYGCWELLWGYKPRKIASLSPTTNRPAMLCAPIQKQGPPTMVLGGFTMHRVVGDSQKPGKAMDPGLDTAAKVAASGARRANGAILDTCTGLGYTAIAAAACPGVTRVVTVELDEVSLEMCRRNPWSAALF
ncbi:unnamed protein product, partial [Phaeothamnion confervicola]